MQSKTRDGYFEHVPMSLEATPFPQMQYIRGVELARIFNTLVENISQNPEWLLRVLTPVQTYDSFTASLMDLQREVIDVGEKQKIHLGINRSDYMLHVPSFSSSGVNDSGISMLQVELNTIASSFGSLSALVTGLHKYLLEGRLRPRGVLGTIPTNDSVGGIARAIATAHREYMNVRPATDVTASLVPSKATASSAVMPSPYSWSQSEGVSAAKSATPSSSTGSSNSSSSASTPSSHEHPQETKRKFRRVGEQCPQSDVTDTPVPQDEVSISHDTFSSQQSKKKDSLSPMTSLNCCSFFLYHANDRYAFFSWSSLASVTSWISDSSSTN